MRYFELNIFKEINLSLVDPDPNQPRKDFQEDKLLELAESISAIGVKQAITIREKGDRYVIIAGERRYRASKLVNKETIPAIIIKEHEQLTHEMIFSHQLSENLHRQDLNPVEKAEFIQERIEELKAYNISNPGQQIASELGVSDSTISKWLGVLKISEDLRALAKHGKIRDYSALKKVEKLKGVRRTQALSMINNGEFVAKDFFSRKRRKVKNSNKEKQEMITNDKPKVDIKKKEKTVKLSLTVSELKRYIEKTDFKYSINSLSEEDKKSLYENPENLLKKFKDWIIS